jgi:hypothetical protein
MCRQGAAVIVAIIIMSGPRIMRVPSFEDTAMSLHVGQQVVCINDVFSPCPYWRRAVRAWPKLGMIYTIRDMREVDDLLGLCFL